MKLKVNLLQIILVLLLLKLQTKYTQLLNVANSKGIDLYDGSLGYYRIKKNVEDIQEHKTRWKSSFFML